MMGRLKPPLQSLSLLCKIVKEEIYQHSVNLLRISMHAQDFSPNQFDGPDTAPAKLDFGAVSAGDPLQGTDAVIQGWTVG